MSANSTPRRSKTETNIFRRKFKESPLQGQYSLEGDALSGLHLNDKIPANAHTIFVGINPAIRSAQVGHYYAHPTNRFWNLIHASGISPAPVTAEDDDIMFKHGFGFTDVAKRPTPDASTLQRHDYADARDRLKNLSMLVKPKTIAFVSKMAARAFIGKGPSHPVSYGMQEFKIHDSRIWFLPSTSGQSYRDTSYDEKLVEFKLLAEHISTYFEWEELN